MAKSAAMQVVRKDTDNFDKFLKRKIREDLVKIYVPQIREVIMQNYDVELVGRVTDRNSRTNPIYYREEFEEALDNFNWLEIGMKYTILVVPDNEIFPWNTGRLRILQNIVEGTIGNYVEVDEEQYVALYKKQPVLALAYDKTVPRKERIYLLRYTPALQRREREVFSARVLVRFPFSNTPAIRLFEPAIEFAEENGSGWVSDITKKATKEYYK
jgi:hypothetical protein